MQGGQVQPLRRRGRGGGALGGIGHGGHSTHYPRVGPRPRRRPPGPGEPRGRAGGSTAGRPGGGPAGGRRARGGRTPVTGVLWPA
ncbi:hypothetical protein E7744_10675 [Citricoccus sp. SGAir0253]|nr:hypothetical protein E7744_10675 [Citricoccus sp. SGAir0253]